MPLCYNVFMGGIWGEPTKENLIPLIEKTGELGLDVFCIDAGWYRSPYAPEDRNNLGDYGPDETRFGEEGLQGVLDKMIQNKMVPGLWFELEATNINTQGSRNGEGMLKRNGTVISKTRGIYDLGDPLVRKHLFDAIDRVYKMGMRFIKNDHNYTQGLGYGDKDYSKNNRKNMEDFYSFIDELRAKYPDLIIENCGSGGMRSDNGTLRHFHLQSTSDQETFYNNPSIVAGSLALMPPEKAGIWVYPYAATVHENNKLYFESEKTEEILESIKNRNQDTHTTVFNMVTGQLGLMYLSGRLDLMDNQNQALVEEGIAIFKRNREFVKNAYPIYPMGFTYIGKKDFYSMGLTDENANEIKLAIWKINAANDACEFDLTKYVGKTAKIENVYPKNSKYSFENGVLKATLDKATYQAVFFEISAK